jgi:hypothetical protein
MLDDPSRKRRETAAATLGLNAYSAWNTALYHHAIRTKIGHELRAEYDLPNDIPHQVLTLLMQLNASQGDERPCRAGGGAI